MNLTNYFFIDNHGCAKNQTDAELIVGFLTENGFIFTENPELAEFILINSCGFIESAKKESINSICNIKKNYPNAKIILTGCLAERYSKDLAENMNELSGVFGNGCLSKIVEFMKEVQSQKNNSFVKTFEQKGVCSGNRPILFNFPSSAFVKITEGCSNFCSFCAIPLIRGKLRSRNENEILNEIQQLINDGVYEINLIGQDLAAYGSENNYEQTKLSFLLSKISKLQGEFIIRLLYIHPDHFTYDILEAIKNDNRILHYFDIPFQSGDDKIILSMNRTGSQKKYIELVNKIKNVLPDSVLRTTFLTGFPGETEENAQNTLDFLQKIEPDWSGCFPYSREEDTPAYKMKNRVSSKIAKKRAEVLQKVQTKITEKSLKKYIGTKTQVLIEEVIETEQNNEEGLAIGRAWFQAPEVDGCVVIRYENDNPEEKSKIVAGNVILVQILNCTGIDLDAKFVSLTKEFKPNSNRKYLC